MDSFYTRLLKLSFPDSVTAIEYCRELSSQYGFTVKQEASSNRVSHIIHLTANPPHAYTYIFMKSWVLFVIHTHIFIFVVEYLCVLL